MTSQPRSMRFQVQEVLAGALASLPSDTFSDDHAFLGRTFKHLSSTLPLFAPYAALVDESDYSSALDGALRALVERGWLVHEPGHYTITAVGRAACISSKRTLFNRGDVAQLEEAAAILGAAEPNA
ncbi:MAG: hypothetical protein KatS3mg060_0023 [Dehalococcoidia bacterium]|nr:MAG: hypothetical protein KatS3mg060_0023 [Dehalococcoidia bacterium]